MNSILDEQIAFDTNEFIFGVRQTPGSFACTELLFEKSSRLNLYIPLQVLLELQRNLTDSEMRGVFLALHKAKSVQFDYSLAKAELIAKWEAQGAKKGDAVIAAHLEAANVFYLISENRHFLTGILGLPFQVLTSQQVVSMLAG